ncbi:hypothetical protein Tco_0864396 [Tanacetum coccineum]
MSNHEQPTPSHPKSDVRNTVGKNKQTPQGSARTTSAVDLEEFCEKHYEKLLPIMADKYECEQRKKEKLEEVKARLDFGEARKKTTRAQESAYSESRTMSPRRQRRSRSPRHNPSINIYKLKTEPSKVEEATWSNQNCGWATYKLTGYLCCSSYTIAENERRINVHTVTVLPFDTLTGSS